MCRFGLRLTVNLQCVILPNTALTPLAEALVVAGDLLVVGVCLWSWNT